MLASVIDVFSLLNVHYTVYNRLRNKNGSTENRSLLCSYFKSSLWHFSCLRKANPPYCETVQVWADLEKGELEPYHEIFSKCI